MKPFFLSWYEHGGGFSPDFISGGGPRGQLRDYLGLFQAIKPFLLERF